MHWQIESQVFVRFGETVFTRTMKMDDYFGGPSIFWRGMMKDNEVKVAWSPWELRETNYNHRIKKI